MNIAILSRNAALYSTRRLREATESRGHEVRIVGYLRCYMNITSRRPQVTYAGKELEFLQRNASPGKTRDRVRG
jgi:ribosomal protein S6--L-glutamate ligase